MTLNETILIPINETEQKSHLMFIVYLKTDQNQFNLTIPNPRTVEKNPQFNR